MRLVCDQTLEDSKQHYIASSAPHDALIQTLQHNLQQSLQEQTQRQNHINALHTEQMEASDALSTVESQRSALQTQVQEALELRKQLEVTQAEGACLPLCPAPGSALHLLLGPDCDWMTSHARVV